MSGAEKQCPLSRCLMFNRISDSQAWSSSERMAPSYASTWSLEITYLEGLRDLVRPLYFMVRGDHDPWRFANAMGPEPRFSDSWWSSLSAKPHPHWLQLGQESYHKRNSYAVLGLLVLGFRLAVGETWLSLQKPCCGWGQGTTRASGKP